MAMREVQVEIGHKVTMDRVHWLGGVLREPGLVEFLNPADMEQLRVITQKPKGEATHADVVWLAGKIGEVCGKEEPRFKTMMVDDGVNPAAIRPA